MSASFESFQYLDLYNYQYLSRLADLNLYFSTNRNSIICLDEVRLIPELFSFLRSEIDSNRRNRRFILLGSASQILIQKSS